MNESEKLKIYLDKIKEIATYNVEEKNTSALQALKEALNYIEGAMVEY